MFFGLFCVFWPFFCFFWPSFFAFLAFFLLLSKFLKTFEQAYEGFISTMMKRSENWLSRIGVREEEESNKQKKQNTVITGLACNRCSLF